MGLAALESTWDLEWKSNTRHGNTGTMSTGRNLSVSHCLPLGQCRAPAKAGQSHSWHTQQAGGSKGRSKGRGWAGSGGTAGANSRPIMSMSDGAHMAPSNKMQSCCCFPSAFPNLKQIPLVASPDWNHRGKRVLGNTAS